jgi:hypothetical protein
MMGILPAEPLIEAFSEKEEDVLRGSIWSSGRNGVDICIVEVGLIEFQRIC